MELAEYENIFENEKSHFFYVANHKIVLSLVKKYLTKKGAIRILDAGCGTGLLTQKLAKYGSVVGIDNSLEALKFAKKRKVNIKLASVNKLPFEKNHFDLIVSIDVIYHQQVNDKKSLNEFFRVLKPSGILILRVPAVKWLKLTHDKYVHTRKRYGEKELKRKIKSAGFLIEKLSFVNMALLPLTIIRHFLEKLNPPQEITSAVTPPPLLINKILTFVLSLEATFLSFTNLPFGIGLLAVCRKPPENHIG